MTEPKPTKRGQAPGSRRALQKVNAKKTARARPHLAKFHDPEHLAKMRQAKAAKPAKALKARAVQDVTGSGENVLVGAPPPAHKPEESPSPPPAPPETLALFSIKTPRQRRTFGLFQWWSYPSGQAIGVRTDTVECLRARLGDREVWWCPSMNGLVDESALDPLPLPAPPPDPEHVKRLALIDRDRDALLSGHPLREHAGTFETGAGSKPKLGKLDWEALYKI